MWRVGAEAQAALQRSTNAILHRVAVTPSAFARMQVVWPRRCARTHARGRGRRTTSAATQKRNTCTQSQLSVCHCSPPPRGPRHNGRRQRQLGGVGGVRRGGTFRAAACTACQQICRRALARGGGAGCSCQGGGAARNLVAVGAVRGAAGQHRALGSLARREPTRVSSGWPPGGAARGHQAHSRQGSCQDLARGSSGRARAAAARAAKQATPPQAPAARPGGPPRHAAATAAARRHALDAPRHRRRCRNHGGSSSARQEHQRRQPVAARPRALPGAHRRLDGAGRLGHWPAGRRARRLALPHLARARQPSQPPPPPGAPLSSCGCRAVVRGLARQRPGGVACAVPRRPGAG